MVLSTMNDCVMASIMPHRLDIRADRGDSFSVWKSRWEDYGKLTKLAEKDAHHQMAVFRSCLSDSTLRILMNLDLPDADRNKPDKVIEALQVHVHGQLNIVMGRRTFYLHCQQLGESINAYLTDLHDLAKTCEFCDNCLDGLICDHIVVGLRDSDTIEHLLVEKGLTLTKAVDICCRGGGQEILQ